MSQLIIKKNHRLKHEEDDDADDSSQNYERSRYLTPKKYRTQVNHNEDNTRLLYKKYPVVIGDFTLTQPIDDRSFYSYKPKHTNTSYIYHGSAHSSEVLERARNEITQYAQSTSPVRKKIPFMNNRTHYQSMLTLPTTNSHPTTDDHFVDEYSRDSLYESPHRRNQSCSSLYPRHPPKVFIEPKDRYYFGERSEYHSPDDDDEEEELSTDDERCIIFGSNSRLKPTVKAVIEFSTFIPPHDDDDELSFQEVVDVGTSTDDLLVYATLHDRRETDFNPQQQQPLATNPSSHSETGVYRVSRQSIEQNNYEEPDTVPFPTVKPSSRISSNSSSSAPSIRIPPPSEKNRSSKTNPFDEQENYYVEDEDDDDEDFPSPPAPEPPSRLQRLPQQNPVAPLPASRNDYVPITREPEPMMTSKSTKSNRSRRRPKPHTVLPQISDGFHGPSTAVNLRRASSTPVTDLDDELINGEINFRLSRGIPRTPGPRARSPHPDLDDNEDDSDRIPPRRSSIRRPPTATTIKLITEGTQSEEKTTRNVGTMHEPVQTKNFGNEVQPQSSSTQTPSPKKASFAYIERPEPPLTIFDEQRISPRSPDIYYDRYSSLPRDRSDRRSPSPQIIDYVYDDEDYSRRDRSRSPPPISYHYTTRLPPDHPPTTIYRSPTPSPPRRSRHPSLTRHSHSATTRHRPRMHSQETDTSLDAMKPRQHIGVQYEPRSTRETGTSPSIRLKRPVTPIHRSIDTSRYPQQMYPLSYNSLPRHHDRSDRDYYIQPTTNDYHQEEEEEEEEDEVPSMHDQSTMAELIVNLDHYTQCEPRPYMADHYVQTTPTLDEYEQRNITDLSEEPLIRQLPGRNSISIPQPFVIQPPTLPRRSQHHSPTRPKRDGLDYTGKILEVSPHRGQQQRTTSVRYSPLLNLGTEHVLHQLPANEYTIPFETRYIYDSLHSSTTKSRRNSSTRMPLPDSPRTHLYTNNSLRQSRSNGNFFLSAAPLRSMNSSFRLNITADQS